MRIAGLPGEDGGRVTEMAVAWFWVEMEAELQRLGGAEIIPTIHFDVGEDNHEATKASAWERCV